MKDKWSTPQALFNKLDEVWIRIRCLRLARQHEMREVLQPRAGWPKARMARNGMDEPAIWSGINRAVDEEGGGIGGQWNDRGCSNPEPHERSLVARLCYEGCRVTFYPQESGVRWWRGRAILRVRDRGIF